MASADLRVQCDVCDLEVECRARFDSVLDIESILIDFVDAEGLLILNGTEEE